MALLIRGGTVVNADLQPTRRCARRGRQDRRRRREARRHRPERRSSTPAAPMCMPGGIDPHTHMELMFMGTVSADDFEWGTKAALSGGTTMIVDFCIPAPGAIAARRLSDWRQQIREGCRRTIPSTWRSPGGPTGLATRWRTVVTTHGVNTFKHFMAYKGALMVDDDDPVPFLQALRRAGRHRRWSMPRTATWWRSMQDDVLAQGITGPEGHAYSRPPEVEGEAANRAIMIADMAGCPLYIVHTSCKPGPRGDHAGAAEGKRVFGEPLIQHLMLDETDYLNRTGITRRGASCRRRSGRSTIRTALWAGLQSGSLSDRRDRPLLLHHRAEAHGRQRFPQDPERHRRA